MIGNTVGTYKITEKIGEGGMGAVFKGVDLMLEREVAIKVLRPELAGQPEIVERFRAEAVTLARLNHPRIATLYSFFRHVNDFLMVMEYVHGETLGDVINRHGAIDPAQAVAAFSQALEGIEHAHSLGIIHRDIKPGNIMITPRGAVKVMDFGIARVLGAARMTKAGHLVGTIEYMSPEQVRGKHTDERSDIYSAGIVLYEMLTGRVPFMSDSEYDLMRQQIEEAPPPPRKLSAHIPDAVEAAILCALAKNPEDRFATAGDFQAALLEAHPAAARVAEARERRSSKDYAAPKETVLASSKEPAAPAKGTRLAPDSFAGASAARRQAPEDSAAREVAAPPPATSLLDRLNWKHFAAAAVVLPLLIFGVTALIFYGTGTAGPIKPQVDEKGGVNPPPAAIVVPSAGVPGTNASGAGEQRPAPRAQTADDLGIQITNTNANTNRADDTGAASNRNSSEQTARSGGGGGNAGQRARPAARSENTGQRAKRDTSAEERQRARERAKDYLDQ